MNHRIGEKWISVKRLRRILTNHRFHVAWDERAGVHKKQPSRCFHNCDPSPDGVVLVGDTVVQRLSNHPGVVLSDLAREKGAVWQRSDDEVA